MFLKTLITWFLNYLNIPGVIYFSLSLHHHPSPRSISLSWLSIVTCKLFSLFCFCLPVVYFLHTSQNDLLMYVSYIILLLLKLLSVFLLHVEQSPNFLVPVSPNFWVHQDLQDLTLTLYTIDFFSSNYLFLERGEEKEKERERNINVWLPLTHLRTIDLTCNPGMCPDWELNQWLFGLQASTQSTEPHQPGLQTIVLFNL